MPIYDPESDRKKYIEDFLNSQPARQDLPIMERTFWGSATHFQLNAQALIGIRLKLNKWFFWWYNLDGEFEPDESNPFKDIEIDTK